VPGFRKGHVPRSLLEARFGSSFEQETLERAVEQACRRAFAEQKIVPLTPAEVEDLKFTQGGPLTFKAVVEVRPEVEAKDYRGVAVTRRTREITDADVERELAALVEQTATIVDVGRPAGHGDLLVVDYVRVDAKGQLLKSTRRRDFDMELGAEGLLPAFETALTGATAGESRTVLVDYPADFSNAELAGQQARFHVKIKKIREKKRREADDNWAREVFGLGSLDELRARLRLNLEGEARLEAREAAEESLIEALLTANSVPVPDRWAERRVAEEMEALERRAGRALPPEQAEAYRGQIRDSLGRSVQREFLLEAIARQEGIEITDEEVGAELARVAQAGGRTSQEFRRLAPDERRRRVRDALERRKIFDFLLENAHLSEEQIASPSPLVTPA
jgi:trigger factor